MLTPVDRGLRALGHLDRIISDLGWGALEPVSVDCQWKMANIGNLVRWCQTELRQSLEEMAGNPTDPGDPIRRAIQEKCEKGGNAMMKCDTI